MDTRRSSSHRKWPRSPQNQPRYGFSDWGYVVVS